MISDNTFMEASQNDNIISKNKIVFKKKNKYDIKEVYKLNNNKLQIDYINQFNEDVMSSFQFQSNSEMLNQILSNCNNNNNNNNNNSNNNNNNSNNIINSSYNDNIETSKTENTRLEIINSINNFGLLDDMLNSWGNDDENKLISIYKENKNSSIFYFSNMPSDASLFLPSFFTLPHKKKPTTYIQKQINKLKQRPKINSSNSLLTKKNKKYKSVTSITSSNNNSQISISKKNRKSSSSNSLISTTSSQSVNQGINENKTNKNNFRNLKNTNYIKKNHNSYTKSDVGSNKSNPNITITEQYSKNPSDIGKNKLKMNDKKLIKTIKNNINSETSNSLDSSSSSFISLDKLSDKTQTSLPPLTNSSFSCIDFSLEKKGMEFGKLNNDSNYSKLNGIQKNINSALLQPIPQHH